MLEQAAINAAMRPWGDAEHRRFDFRVSLFQRRGMQGDAAEALADRLALRDQQLDERRMCLECKHMQRSGHCVAAKQRRVRLACDPERFTVLPRALQRCPSFAFVTP